MFWVRNGGGSSPDLSDLQAFADDFGGAYNSHLLKYTYVEVAVSKIVALYYGATGADLGAEAARSDTGDMASNPLPNNIATCISWHIQPRYKGGHPRTYLPHPDMSALEDGRLFTTAFKGAVQADANAFLNSVNAMTHGALSDLHLGTVSFVLRKAWRTPPVFRDYSPNAATVDQRVDSMRRRLGRDIL